MYYKLYPDKKNFEDEDYISFLGPLKFVVTRLTALLNPALGSRVYGTSRDIAS